MGHRTPVKMLTGAPLLLAISLGIGDAVGGPGEYITTAPPAASSSKIDEASARFWKFAMVA